MTGGNVLDEKNKTSAPKPIHKADASTMNSHGEIDINDQMDSDSSKQDAGKVLAENNYTHVQERLENKANSAPMATDEVIAEQNEELGISKKTVAKKNIKKKFIRDIP